MTNWNFSKACNLEEAENLYDQLAPICPILLALTASSPIFKVRHNNA